MPIIRQTKEGVLDEQRAGREIGQLRSGKTRPNPNGGRPIPMSLETIRFTTTKEESAEALAAKYNSTPVRTELANGQKTIEVMTQVKTIEAIIPPGGAAISQWRELWSGGWCQRRCDAVTETKTQTPCKCPFDPAERKALAAEGEACKDTTRVNLILPDIPGLGVWRLTTGSFFAGIEMGMTVEFLADLSAKGLPLPVIAGIDSRTGVLPPKGPNGKPLTTKFPVWVVDPIPTASEIAGIANTGYGMLDALSPGSNLAISTGGQKAIDCSSSAPAVESQLDEELASPGQRKAIRDRLALLSPIDKATFDRWSDNEKRAGGIHTFAQLRATEVEIVIAKLDVIDPKNAPPEWDDDEPIDAEIIEDAI